MGFSSLSQAHQIMILLALKGGPAYSAQMDAAAVSTGRFSRSLLTTSANMELATKRSWLHNQALFTLRRYAFYATLGVTGLVYEIGKLGFEYNSTVQSGRVALKGMFDTRREMDRTIDTLYKLSTQSPFLFKDTLTAFRTMAPAMKNAGIPVSMTLNTMRATMDALSQSGHTSVGNLTRVSIQLQHLANIGRPTGQVLLALARDGLPVYPALRKELGLTGTSLENMSESGYTAAQVIAALNKFIETSPIYRGQAFKQATSTLRGNWQMFKDILSQAAGRSTGGLFMGLQDRLTRVNKYLAPLFRGNKPITLTNIAEAIDYSLTPKTHILINMFILLRTTLSTVIAIFGFLSRVITAILTPIDWLISGVQSSHLGAKILGYTLGSLIALFVVAKLVLLPFTLAIDLWRAGVEVAKTAAIVYGGAIRFLNFMWGLATGETLINTGATAANTVANEANTLSMRQQYDAMIAKNAIMGATIAETDAATVSTGLFAGAMDALAASFLVDPLFWIPMAIIGLTLLYFKWRAFHDAVNKTVRFLYNNPLATMFIPLVGQLIAMTHALVAAYHAAKRIVALLPGHGGGGGGIGWGSLLNIPGDVVGGFTGIPIPKIHRHQFGGISHGGWSMVGERGPELMHLPASTKISPIGRRTLEGAGSFVIKVYPQPIYLNGKQIGTAMATAITDKEARA